MIEEFFKARKSLLTSDREVRKKAFSYRFDYCQKTNKLSKTFQAHLDFNSFHAGQFNPHQSVSKTFSIIASFKPTNVAPQNPFSKPYNNYFTTEEE